jgi:hypothetical protein
MMCGNFTIDLTRDAPTGNERRGYNHQPQRAKTPTFQKDDRSGKAFSAIARAVAWDLHRC